MLETTNPLVLARLACTRINENELGMDGGGGISNSRIDDRIVNLSSSTKKMSFKVGFLLLKLV